MQNYASINSKINEGYTLLRKNQTVECCQKWLDAWEDIKAVMADGNIRDLHKLQENYSWTEFILNYVQELEMELGNAALDHSEYAHKRILYCWELLDVLTDQDQLCIENTRRAIAESHHMLGNSTECDRLFEGWLTDHPDWGRGWIGWASCYIYGEKSGERNLARAGSIIKRALAIEGLRDRGDVIERAIEIFSELEERDLVEQLETEMSTTVVASGKRLFKQDKPKAKVVKIGRNEPCTCGSGKKYKKCCGK